MKKSFLLAIILLAFNSLFANPVDVDRAKELGQKFVDANFEQKSSSLELVYTANTELGEPCFYVFSVSNHGFVIVSADDCAHPILGYSEESAFEADDIAPGLGDMMGIYKEAISFGMQTKATATPEIAAEWKSLEMSGKVKPAMRGQGVEPLCTTKWNQSWPYNKFCPEQSASWADHGHVVVGCVATAMAQMMAYWDYPTQGQGTHTYTPRCSECGQYGTYPQQTVNFGATTYDWENMVDHIDASSPVEQIDAIATLSYHCGVAVDMMYDHHGTGSGAYSTTVTNAIQSYFKYAPTEYKYRDMTPTWDNDLRDCLDRSVPVYYSGSDEEGYGHAFVCDGYDENGLFHFNFGWGGSGDGYFTTAAMQYHVGSGAIFNFMPAEVYSNTAQAPTDLSVTPVNNTALSATLTWTNPSKLLNNSNISSIDKIVVERDGKIIHEETANTTPGAQVTFVDNTVPCFSYFNYAVYAVINGSHGKVEREDLVSFGPRCDWQMLVQSSAFQGMRGASVSVYDAAGVCFETKTTTNSVLASFDIPMPLGKVQFTWNPHSADQDEYNLTIIIKDANGETVFNYTGLSTELSAGVIYSGDNTCGEENQCEAPSGLIYNVENDALVLSWNAAGNPEYGYNIFRDGLLIAMSDGTTFTDDDVPFGGHCYTVTALCSNGNSSESNEVCAVLTEDCDPASNLWYDYTSSNKVKISWDAPQSENISGYYVMSKIGNDGEWTRHKVLGSNKVDYTDTRALEEGKWYFYKVIAYYQDTDCLSAPAKSRYNDEYFVKVYYSTTDIEDMNAEDVNIYPNPVDDNLKIEAKSIKKVAVINLMGQNVYESEVNADEVILNMSEYKSGVYMIQVTTEENTITKRISVAH